MFRRHSGLSVSEFEKSELGGSHPVRRTESTESCSGDAVHTAEGDSWVYERFLHDENSAVVNSAFPFSYLFEDVFLTPPLNDTSL